MKNKGITLIALVITIIIMLILVAVTVNYTVKSGLLEKAKVGKEREIIEQNKELAMAKIAEWKIDFYSKKNPTSLQEFLNEKFGEENIEKSGNDFTLTCLDGTKLLVKNNGDVKELVDEKDEMILYRMIEGDDGDFRVDYWAYNEVDSKVASITFAWDEDETEEFFKFLNYCGKIEKVDKVNDGDMVSIKNHDYNYLYNSENNGWSVELKNNHLNSYGDIKDSIFDIPVTRMYRTFDGCQNLIVAPTIPSSVRSIENCFNGSSVREASYDGTVEEFEKIEGVNAFGNITFHCKDGDYKK